MGGWRGGRSPAAVALCRREHRAGAAAGANRAPRGPVCDGGGGRIRGEICAHTSAGSAPTLAAEGGFATTGAVAATAAAATEAEVMSTVCTLCPPLHELL